MGRDSLRSELDLKKKKQHRSHINGGKIFPELTESMSQRKYQVLEVGSFYSQRLQETKSSGTLDQISSQPRGFGLNLFGKSSAERMAAGKQRMMILTTMLLATEGRHSNFHACDESDSPTSVAFKFPIPL